MAKASLRYPKTSCEAKIDGWLLYDFQNINPLAREFLKIHPELILTRRYFYWIPAKGDPIKILHRIEMHILADLPGRMEVYLTWQELENAIGIVLKGSATVAMEYSPKNAIPYLSKVDAGTVDVVRSFGIDVVSSGSFLQYFTCVLDVDQLKSHLDATNFLDKVVAQAWDNIATALKKGSSINEYQVRMFIADQMTANGFITEGLPICAVNAHSADPHFEPQKTGSSEIKRGDFVLIDLWCKKNSQSCLWGYHACRCCR